MNKYNNINKALDWLNEIKDTYSFVEINEHTSKKHIKETIDDIEEILSACKNALEVFDDVFSYNTL